MNISLFRSVAEQYRNLRQVNTVAMMNVISHQIEDQIIQHQLPVDFYAGFQRFSNFPEQLRRYSRLGSVCRRVFVFGIADCQPPSIPGVEFIELSPTCALSHEWFLLVNTPTFWTALITQEVEGRDQTVGGRRFDGLWSFDEEVVDRLSLLMSQVMETNYNPIASRNYNQQNTHITEISTRMLGVLEKSELSSQRRWARLHTLQQMVEVPSKDLAEMVQDTAQILHKIFGASSVAITLGTDRQGRVAAVAGDAVGSDRIVSLSESTTGRAIQDRRLVQIKEVRQSADGDPLLPAARALIAVPLANRQLHGAITVGTLEPNQWDDEDGRTVAVVARMLASRMDQTSGFASSGFASSSNGMKFPLEVGDSLRRVVAAQEAPIANMLTLHRRLRSLGPFTASQLTILVDMEATLNNLIQTVKVAKRLVNKDLE